jgi:mono/diheme cytochrome c family protein
MLKHLMVFALAAACSTGFAAGLQTPGTVVVPVDKTSPDNGKQMYASYCASCHGAYGKGDGPVGLALKQPPADLTMLSRNNGGKFPSTHVIAVLQFGSKASAHGTAEMPVWGPIFGRIDANQPQPTMKSLRISNLVQYIETLQVK